MPADDPRNEDSPDDRSGHMCSDDFWREVAHRMVQRQEAQVHATLKERFGIGRFQAHAHQLGLPAYRIQLAKALDAAADKLDKIAQKIAAHYELKYARVRAALERAFCFHPLLGPGQQLEFIQNYGPMFRPNLAALFKCFQPCDALALLESDELPQIQKRLTTIEYLNLDFIPFYTLDELRRLTESFISYLEDNREHLIETGHLRTSFEQSYFFESNLGRVYYVKLPVDVEKTRIDMSGAGTERQRTTSDHVFRGYAYNYTWATEVQPTQLKDRARNISHCTYDEADLMHGINPADAARIEDMRSKFIEFKLGVLHILWAALDEGEKRPSKKCLQLLSESLKPADVEFCRGMDTFYVNHAYAVRKSDRTVPYVSVGKPGGLANLLGVIWYFEEELSIGSFRRTRSDLGDLVKVDSLDRPRLPQRQYLSAIGTQRRQVMDDAFDLLDRLQDEGRIAQQEYDERVARTFTVPGAQGEKVLGIQDHGKVVRYFGQEVELTPLQRKVFLALAERPNRPLDYYDLGEAGWSPDFPSDFAYVRRVIGEIRAALVAADRRAHLTPSVTPDELIRNRRGRYDGGGTYMLALGSEQIEWSCQIKP